MLKFIRDSIKEFDHVVWPTHAETRRYFSVVISVIVALGVILFVASTVISNSLIGARKVTAPASSVSSSAASNQDISKILSGASLQFNTGSVSKTGSTSTGVVVTSTGAKASTGSSK